MDQSEAIATGNQVCASRGYACRLESVKQTGHRVWKLKYAVSSGGARGEYKLELDGDTRQVLKEKEHFKHEKHEKHDKHDKHDKDRGHHDDD